MASPPPAREGTVAMASGARRAPVPQQQRLQQQRAARPRTPQASQPTHQDLYHLQLPQQQPQPQPQPQQQQQQRHPHVEPQPQTHPQQTHQQPRSVRESRLYRALQSECDTLRFQLHQAQQERDALRQELETVRALPSADGGRTALEERCRLLADRLLYMTRDRQVSQSAEVLFLLRCQQEERQFLSDTLSDLLEDMGLPQSSSQQQQPQSASRDSSLDQQPLQQRQQDGRERRQGAVHTHQLSQQASQLAEGLHASRAAIALERARVRLCLEQLERLTQEVQEALVKATRTVFDTATELSGLLIHGGAPPAILPPSSGSIFTPLRAPLAPSAQRQETAQPFLSSVNSSGVSASAHGRGPTAGGTLQSAVEDLGWACDVLKASHHGLGTMLATLRAAQRTQTAETPVGALAARSYSRARSGSQSTADSQGGTATAVDSPEMDQLLSSFRAELLAMQTRGAQSHERVARRLARELKRHYEAAKQYESRIRTLEAENAKLLIAQEKTYQRERQQRQRERAGLEAQGAAPAQDVTPERAPVPAYAEEGRHHRRKSNNNSTQSNLEQQGRQSADPQQQKEIEEPRKQTGGIISPTPIARLDVYDADDPAGVPADMLTEDSFTLDSGNNGSTASSSSSSSALSSSWPSPLPTSQNFVRAAPQQPSRRLSSPTRRQVAQSSPPRLRTPSRPDEATHPFHDSPDHRRQRPPRQHRQERGRPAAAAAEPTAPTPLTGVARSEGDFSPLPSRVPHGAPADTTRAPPATLPPPPPSPPSPPSPPLRAVLTPTRAPTWEAIRDSHHASRLVSPSKEELVS